MKKRYSSIDRLINMVREYFPNQPKVAQIMETTLYNTIETTLIPQNDGKTFVITGDIPAMWLRDSSAQVKPLLLAANSEPEIFNLILGVIKQHKQQILIDPYANAFNKDGDFSCFNQDLTEMKAGVWERKYEVDSLCYPIQLAYLFWKYTNYTDHFDRDFLTICQLIVNTFQMEQHHETKSTYRFVRKAAWLDGQPERVKYETLARAGLGTPVGYTGMTWSGFRPSDDACQYGYLIPSNMFAYVNLGYMKEILQTFYNDESNQKDLVNSIMTLQTDIRAGIEHYGIVKHSEYGYIYAYEVDGLGNYLLMDDANVPSLLSAPYLGFCKKDDKIYLNTRRLILSKVNPYYYEGLFGQGIGSPHSPNGYIWPIALCVQGLTSNYQKEKEAILNMLLTTDADTLMMHESFNVDNPNQYTRAWFSWANSMYTEFVLSMLGITITDNPK